MNCDEIDAQKLHAESLQLRNQQFQLGTIALAGSGLSAWVAPGLTAITDGEVPELALLAGSILWLVLLTLLFLWSLALRRMIIIIGKYLDIKDLSLWEAEFHTFHLRRERLYTSQTLFIASAFTVYGGVAVLGSICASLAMPEKIVLTPPGLVCLLVSLGIYVNIVWRFYARAYKSDQRVEPIWRDVLGIKD